MSLSHKPKQISSFLSTLHRTVPSGDLLVVGCGLVGALLSTIVLGSQSTLMMLGFFGAMGFGALCLLRGEMRLVLLASTFFLAPVDISKGLLTPTVTRFYASGPFYSPGLYLLASQLAVVALLIVWMGKRLLLERRWPPMTGLDWLALAYVCVIWSRSIGTPQGALSMGTAASYTLCVLAFYVVSHTIQSVSDLRVVIKASLVIFFLTFVYVSVQQITQLPLPFPFSKGLAFGTAVSFAGEGVIFRPVGFMLHPNALAHYTIIMLPPAAALCLLGPSRLPYRVWLLSTATAVCAMAMLLVTLSRGGWFSAILSVSAIVFVYARKGIVTPRQLGYAAICAAIGAIVLVTVYPTILLRLTAPDGRSLESRVLLADMAFTIIKANPWIGVGFGEYNRAAFEYVSPLYANVSSEYQFGLHQLVVHNHFLLIAAELGIPAMFFFIYVLWRIARLPWSLSRWRDPAAFALATGLAAAVVGETLFFNSDNYYTDIRIFVFWLAAGVLQALMLIAKRESRT